MEVKEMVVIRFKEILKERNMKKMNWLLFQV